MRTLAVYLLGSLALTLISLGVRADRKDIEIDVAKLGSPQTIYVYDGGSIALKRAIGQDSEEAREILKWLEAHKEGWEYSLPKSITSFAPQHHIRGEHFSLDFSKDGRSCILNCPLGQKKGKWQLTRKIAKDDPIPRVFHAVP